MASVSFDEPSEVGGQWLHHYTLPIALDHVVVDRVARHAVVGADLHEEHVASVLGEAIKTLAYDIVLCGKVTIDDTDSYVGPAIAELLNLPQVSAITKLEISPE